MMKEKELPAVLHLEASTGWGGQEMRILKEAKGMREKGYPIFLAVQKGGSLVRYAKEAGFCVYEINFKRSSWLFSLFQLLWILRKNQIDIVNTHSSLDSWIGGIAARLAGVKIIRTRHLSTKIKAGLNSRIVYGALADVVVTTCSMILPTIVTQAKKPASRCRCIATGVDPKQLQFSPQEPLEFRKKLGISSEDFVVGTACVMRSWKGVDDLLKAADLLRNIPDIKWVIIGGGHDQRHKNLAKDLHLSQVFFTGHLDPPFGAMASLDLFALLSTGHEGISQSILQAAFLEKPLLSTRTGGLSEVCIDQITGINVPNFSPQKVAEAVLEMKKNPEKRSTFGKRAKKLVLEHFTLEHTLEEMGKVYHQLQNLPYKEG